MSIRNINSNPNLMVGKEDKKRPSIIPIPSPLGAGGGGSSSSGSSGITVGTTTITSGTTTKVLYNNAGVVGEYTITGTGNVVLSASPTLTGTVVLASQTNSGTIVQTSASATAFVSGPNGATNPVFTLVNSTASSATGISITGAAAGSGVTLGVTSSGSNEDLFVVPKGTGALIIQKSATGTQSGYVLGAPADTSNRVVVGMEAGLPFMNFGNGASRTVGVAYSAAGVMRLTNASTGAGQLLIGTSTDTADAQLSVYSQSTTRPGLKLNMPSGTSASQEAFGVYNNGTLKSYIRADGGLFIDGSQLASFGSGATLGISSGIQLASTRSFGWSSGAIGSANDLVLERDAANTLAQRNGTNAQTLRIYETYTDASNYERIEINASATTNTIKPAAAGTGTASKIDYYLTPTVFMSSGTGSPEGVLTAGIGSTYHRTDGGAGTSFYVKESGAGNTGWVAK
jgi:hypothetical protein